MSLFQKLAITLGVIIVVGVIITSLTGDNGVTAWIDAIWEWIFDEMFDTEVPQSPFGG